MRQGTLHVKSEENRAACNTWLGAGVENKELTIGTLIAGCGCSQHQQEATKMTRNRTFTAIVILALGTPFAITLVKLAAYLNTLAN